MGIAASPAGLVEHYAGTISRKPLNPPGLAGGRAALAVVLRGRRADRRAPEADEEAARGAGGGAAPGAGARRARGERGGGRRGCPSRNVADAAATAGVPVALCSRDDDGRPLAGRRRRRRRRWRATCGRGSRRWTCADSSRATARARGCRPPRAAAAAAVRIKQRAKSRNKRARSGCTRPSARSFRAFRACMGEEIRKKRAVLLNC